MTRYIRDYERSFPGLVDSLEKLSAQTFSDVPNERLVLPCLSLLDALSKPLTYQDAAEEKLVICARLTSKMGQHLKKGLGASCFSERASACPKLALPVLGGLSSLLRVWNSSRDGDHDCLKPKPDDWRELFKNAISYATQGGESEKSAASVKDAFLVACLESEGPIRKCLPKKFATKVWKQRVCSPDSFPPSENLLRKVLEVLDEDDLSSILQKVRAKSLVENKRAVHEIANGDDIFLFSPRTILHPLTFPSVFAAPSSRPPRSPWQVRGDRT